MQVINTIEKFVEIVMANGTAEAGIKELPKYNKIGAVKALRIKYIVGFNALSYIMTFEDESYGLFEIGKKWCRKHKPEAGGVFIIDEAGKAYYESASDFDARYVEEGK